jgi:hypothetical protein
MNNKKTCKRGMTAALVALCAGSATAADLVLSVSGARPVVVGATVEVSVRVTNAPAFATWGAMMTFDPARLEFTGRYGAGEDEFVADSRTVERVNATGQARLGGYGFGDEARTGALARVWFQAKAVGVTHVASCTRKDATSPFGDALYTIKGVPLALKSAWPAAIETVSDADTDGDGMADDWEIHHFGGISAEGGGSSDDWDGDGMSNLEEYLAGTDPRSADSALRITGLTAVGGDRLLIRWSSVAGKTYEVRRSENVRSGFGALEADALPATPPMNTHTATLNGVKGFFRVVLE